MRLTLRTLLAYMDDILEPEDSQDIAQKVKDSEYASSLLHRVRDVMRRLRLGAPDVAASDSGLDANTVAEYLDNTLPDEQVPDFEKVCLESDVQLSEVASSHQILTLVLGEPAEVEVASRERMYRLIDEPDDAAEDGAPGLPDHEASDDGDHARRHKPSVPDYLRDPPKTRQRILTAAVGITVAAILAVVVLAALGQFEPGTKLAALLGIEQAPIEQIVEQTTQKEEQAPTAIPTPTKEPEVTPETKPTPESTASIPVPPDKTTVVEKVDKLTPVKATPEQPETKLITPHPEAKADRTSEIKATADIDKAKDKDEPDLPTAADTKKDEVKSPAPPEQMGRFISDNRVLLQFNPESGSWHRVPAQGILIPNRKLLALPTYQPLIALTAGVMLHLTDGTQVELKSTDGNEIPGLQVDYGRLILRTVGKANARLRLLIDGRTGVLTFGDAEATVAIEVSQVSSVGVDPEKNPGDTTLDIFATSGRVEWKDDSDGKSIPINAPSVLRLDDRPVGPAVAVKDFPKWVFSDSVGLLERRASGTMEQSLQQGRSADLGLRELADHRQKEVRWLATRCLAHLGKFDLMVSVLNDPSQKLAWSDYIEQLQLGMSRGPESAKQVRLAFQKEFGDEADGLSRMLWGFTREGLEKGDAAMLVAYLDHKVLAFRVLSHGNLRQITGLGLYYQPEATAAKRQQSVQKWGERLKSGQIWADRTTNSGVKTGSASQKKAAKK